MNTPKYNRSSVRSLRQPRVLDLFSGCGGLSLGFTRAGWEVAAGFDSWSSAVDVYNRNFDHQAFCLDLGDTQGSLQTLRPWMEGVDLIIGGPPCQDFSSAGKRIEGDRADLTQKFALIVGELAPQAFVMENVERAKDAFVYRQALADLTKSGYQISRVVLDASRLGVPQVRKRLFAIGMRDRNPSGVVQRLTESYSAERMTVRDYLGEALGLDYYYRHPRSYARRGIFSIDEPSPTIRGVNRPVPPGYRKHPGDPVAPFRGLRPLTTLERARIQTFPTWFELGVNKTAAEQLVGNAVPVELATHVARQVALELGFPSR